MAPAAWADPELVGRPRSVGCRIAHFHFRAAALTTDVKISLAHAGILADRSAGQGTATILVVVSALVLAAGKSTRMGRPKATLPLGDHETFITHIVKTFQAAGVEDVVVVLGHGAGAIAARLQEHAPAPRIVVNPNYESGQLSSLLAGLEAIERPGVEAMLLTLVDVPLVTAATVRAVVERFRSGHAPIVRPVRGDEHGHPVLISRELFGQLRQADPRSGAKSIVRAHASPAGDVFVEDAGAFADVDTPEDYRVLLNGLREGR